MKNKETDFWTFAWRITSTHTIAYSIAGIFAILVLNYTEIFGVGLLSFMRTTDSVWVAAGPSLQIIRGLILSLVLFPFLTIFLNSKNGWMKFWLLSFGLSYLLTFSASFGSFEGFIYTNVPIQTHLVGFPEAVLYLSIFTLLMWSWYRKPKKIFNVLSGLLVSLILFMSVAGILASLGIIETT